MCPCLHRAARTGAAIVGIGAAALAYGSLIERNAFAVRRFVLPVLDSGAPSVRVLHLSDLHAMSRQRRKLAFISSLADLEPDLVLSTGDMLSDPHGIPALMSALQPLLGLPGGFVPGNNDYFAPKPKNPLRYFAPQHNRAEGEPMPWPELAGALSRAGWTDLTHVRATLSAGGARIALAGTDDPHLRRARYDRIAGPADSSAHVRIGVLHSPEPFLLDRFATDGYDLVLAGHTHGGQIRVPFGPAIVTNCGIDRWKARWVSPWSDRMTVHVSAGLGTSPYSPVRIACRPEATLLTLVPRDAAL